MSAFKKIREILLKNSIYFLTSVLLLLTILLAVQVYINKIQVLNQAVFLSGFIGRLVDNANLIPKSTAEISISGEKLVIKFNILDKDKKAVSDFSSNLNVRDNWIEGISLSLDKKSLDGLAPILPAKVNLKFTSKRADFISSDLPSLRTSAGSTKYEFSTGSAGLKLNMRGEQDYGLEINKPEQLLNYATMSGQITLSKKLDPVFPLFSKIARIELRVNGKNINGFVELK